MVTVRPQECVCEVEELPCTRGSVATVACPSPYVAVPTLCVAVSPRPVRAVGAISLCRCLRICVCA